MHIAIKQNFSRFYARNLLLFTYISFMMLIIMSKEAMDLSEPRLIYPLLDGFLMGQALSLHDGVRCFPAIRHKTGEQYIVKVISIPASQAQMEALLLAGAFESRDAASAYYRELARDVATECESLLQLSNQEGFLSYEKHQVVAASDGPGFEVYLLGKRRTSLAARMEAEPLTHRQALELGLDLCAALAACRRAGYLYVDLKPGNVFLGDDGAWRIGDLGLVSLSSLQFTQIPDRYRSDYIAPEMAADYATIHPTADIYALGMVLYQVCNGGKLPENGIVSAPPLFADYELAAILTKACSQDPDDRWTDPTQFAQALIGYMQRNEVSDAPLTYLEPDPILTESEEADFLPEMSEEELSQEIAALSETEENPVTETEEDIDAILDQAEALMGPDLHEESAEQAAPVAAEPEPVRVSRPIPPPKTFRDLIPTTSQPEPLECPIEKRPFPWRIVISCLVLVALLLGGAWGYRYYTTVYTQYITNLTVTHTSDTATVTVVTDADEGLLQVVCTDSYGNVRYQTLQNGVAVFTDLDPQTRYTIRLEIRGHHKLTGATTGSFTTPEQTRILTFTAGIGAKDGSVLLRFTADGPAVETWTLTGTADGCEPVIASFTGNVVTLRELVIGKEYTFVLSAPGCTLSGCTEVRYTASNIILAQNAAITACGNGQLTVHWDAPENMIPKDGWALRCYNSAGYDQTVVTFEPWYTFQGLDHSVPCTVEITAVGMTRNVSVSIGANPITIEHFLYSVSDEGLIVQFPCGEASPEGGWNVHYTLDGAEFSLWTDTPSFTVDALPGGVYHFTVLAADGAPIFGGTAEYTISEVGTFIGYGVDAQLLTAQLQLPTLTLTAPAETVIEASEEPIEILYILRTADGVLLQAKTETAIWQTLWAENTCTLTIPNLPSEPGSYVLSLYFAGGLVAELEFTVE